MTEKCWGVIVLKVLIEVESMSVNVRDAEDRTFFERLLEGYVRVPDVGGRIVRSQRFGGRECREGARL
jgi:hypothetical protein